MTNLARLIKTKRFNLFEALCLAALVGFIVSVRPTAEPVDPEVAPLAQSYGPGHYSEHEEEWIIRDFFRDRRGGVFVDVGASHYQALSNTYYLEHELGWSGLAVEPMRHFEADYKKFRPMTRFLPLFVSDTSDQPVTMYTLGEKFTGASSDRSWVERFGADPQEITTSTVTLDALLDAQGIKTFDFLSMDIELAEPKALAGLDIERFRPALVGIEAQVEVRQQILDYFARHGYVLVGRYLRADRHNLYFRPAAD